MALTGERVPDRRRMSASTIIFTSAAKSTVGAQPSFWRALMESPIRWSTSAGRSSAGILRDVGLASRGPTCSKAISTSSLDRMAHAGGDDVVVRLVLLEHQPHRAHVVAGEAPVALRVEIAERAACRPVPA